MSINRYKKRQALLFRRFAYFCFVTLIFFCLLCTRNHCRQMFTVFCRCLSHWVSFSICFFSNEPHPSCQLIAFLVFPPCRRRAVVGGQLCLVPYAVGSRMWRCLEFASCPGVWFCVASGFALPLLSDADGSHDTQLLAQAVPSC